jgi:RimJ/RimL family protein N-acetyltransferase
MQLTPITESDHPIIEKWLTDENLLNLVKEANSKADPDKPYEIYILRLSNGDPVGWFSLANIEPGNTAEFGFSVPDKRGSRIAIKAAIFFMIAAFYIYHLKTIYTTPLTNRTAQMAEFVGFKDNIVDLETLERKWM